MKKTIAILAACVLAASVFAGCGGNNNSSSAAESTTAAAEEATTVAAAETENDGISGEWVTSAFVDAEGTEYSVADYAALNGVEASTLEITYAFALLREALPSLLIPLRMRPSPLQTRLPA